jgi:hypothetical protein
MFTTYHQKSQRIVILDMGGGDDSQLDGRFFEAWCLSMQRNLYERGRHYFLILQQTFMKK